jgi:HPt (histidine-containing phosphotransfer) domain-containing protein
MSVLMERIQEIRARFVESLPSRVALIAQLLLRAQGSAAQALALTELEHQLHALAGTAGTYGLHEIAGFARDAEIVCVAYPVDDAMFEQLGGLVASIEDAVRQAA